MAFSKTGTSSTTGTFRGDGPASEINVTPLIDVLLVMLIIFMVIVPDLPRGLNSALPSPVTPGIAGAGTGGAGSDGGAVPGGLCRHGERRGCAAAGGAFIFATRSVNADPREQPVPILRSGQALDPLRSGRGDKVSIWSQDSRRRRHIRRDLN
jgi:hypothetical protein